MLPSALTNKINVILDESHQNTLDIDTEDCPATPEGWDRLISKSLSGSEFDLIFHHSNSYPNNLNKNEANNIKSPTSV